MHAEERIKLTRLHQQVLEECLRLLLRITAQVTGIEEQFKLPDRLIIIHLVLALILNQEDIPVQRIHQATVHQAHLPGSRITKTIAVVSTQHLQEAQIAQEAVIQHHRATRALIQLPGEVMKIHLLHLHTIAAEGLHHLPLTIRHLQGQAVVVVQIADHIQVAATVQVEVHIQVAVADHQAVAHIQVDRAQVAVVLPVEAAVVVDAEDKTEYNI